MFLLGFFSTHIGLAILWIAYLGGVACFSCGLFGGDAVETTENLSQNVIEYRQTTSTNIPTSTSYYFHHTRSAFNPIVAECNESSGNIYHPYTRCLGRLLPQFSQPLFNQFAASFQFSRPPPFIS